MSLNDYEITRQKNIENNRIILNNLGLLTAQRSSSSSQKGITKRRQQPSKPSEATRSSARLAAAAVPARRSPSLSPVSSSPRQQRLPTKAHSRKKPQSTRPSTSVQDPSSSSKRQGKDIDTIVGGWTTWSPSAPPPTRDEEGTFHFPDFAVFQPNKSPAEIIHEGAFGGSYFRPLHSKRLDIIVRDDWRDTLDTEWLTADLDVDRYLISETYEPQINKFGVACGNSIEEWEANGWIAHDYDVRGWFQWYCRFFRGRRCDDDQRQVDRWARCVGQKGRWKRVLLKQYLKRGIRHVMDEEGGEGGEGGEVSPVVSQTCFHWAWEVKQGDLDDIWENGF
ncbi:MAG: hypothetical protein Q9160_006899 [Pyrenula sp. 1 TL-2023]